MLQNLSKRYQDALLNNNPNLTTRSYESISLMRNNSQQEAVPYEKPLTEADRAKDAGYETSDSWENPYQPLDPKTRRQESIYQPLQADDDSHDYEEIPDNLKKHKTI